MNGAIMKKSFIILGCYFLSVTTFAATCPSVHELTVKKESHWLAYDSDSGQRLTPTREAKLKHDINKFALAEWANTNDKSVIHCYYNNAHGSSMEAYFAKESVLPLKSSKYWYKVTGMMQCAAGADKCQFQALPEMTHQLASSES